MVNSEESNFMVFLVEVVFFLVSFLEFYKSLIIRGYGKEENGILIIENS